MLFLQGIPDNNNESLSAAQVLHKKFCRVMSFIAARDITRLYAQVGSSLLVTSLKYELSRLIDVH